MNRICPQGFLHPGELTGWLYVLLILNRTVLSGKSPIVGIDKASHEIKHLSVHPPQISVQPTRQKIIQSMYQQNHRISTGRSNSGTTLFPAKRNRLMKYCDKNRIPYVFINSKLEGKKQPYLYRPGRSSKWKKWQEKLMQKLFVSQR